MKFSSKFLLLGALPAVLLVAGFENLTLHNGRESTIDVDKELASMLRSHEELAEQIDRAVVEGRRLDGWANRDLNVGAVMNLAPDLSTIAALLGVDQPTVRKVLAAWGPGKFDAELLLDGKGFRPDGKSAATLIPPAFTVCFIMQKRGRSRPERRK